MIRKIWPLIAMGALAVVFFREPIKEYFFKPDTKSYQRHVDKLDDQAQNYDFRESGLNLEGIIPYFLYGLEGQTYQGFVDQKDYVYYKSRNHGLKSSAEKDINAYLQELADKVKPENKYIQHLRDNVIYKIANKDDKLDVSQKILDLVHRVPYIPDIKEYAKHPVETLIEGGDCEDLAVLYASLTKACGIDTVLLGVKKHELAAVYVPCKSGTYVEINDKRYYLVETTGTKYPSQPCISKVGEVSKELKENMNILEFIAL